MIARDIIVIGASAGGFEAIQRLVAGLPRDLEAAVFITIHLYPRSEGVLPDLLNRAGPLPAAHPWEETPIEMGRIYVAPPDYHLIVSPKTVHVGHGPKENLHRPCINTMFRSAAMSHGERVAGVLLTGLLDDGSAGLWEIQQHGGVTVVQDPDEAAFRSMPESAILGLNVQYILRLAEIPPLLRRLTIGDRTESRAQQADSRSEHRTMQACPECGGAMTLHTMGRVKEFRCHVGHRFGLKTMVSEKSGVVERAMWKAVSQSEELLQLLEQVQADLDEEAARMVREEITRRKAEQQALRRLVNGDFETALE
ncbi:MAG TPA: chemotaxis protein CheB [Acidobacteriaceae bacterium]|jgi:two-component system chemotaxis response regulator CheB